MIHVRMEPKPVKSVIPAAAGGRCPRGAAAAYLTLHLSARTEDVPNCLFPSISLFRSRFQAFRFFPSRPHDSVKMSGELRYVLLVDLGRGS